MSTWSGDSRQQQRHQSQPETPVAHNLEEGASHGPRTDGTILTMVYSMKIKNFMLVLLLVLVGAVATAALVVIGTTYINHREKGEDTSPLAFLSAKPKPRELQFVEVKNLVMTFRDEHAREHYLLLDLALTTRDDQHSQQTENLLPKIKGFTVDIFSSMSYGDVRSLTVPELRQLMMDSYKSNFGEMNMPMPFDDLTLSKMVFQ
ncbi:flagellar basal body-associated FliL family protein [Erwinia amylovora]